MLRRIMAWLAILGFIFLIIDLSYLKIRLDIAIFMYSMIIIYFVISNFQKKNK